MLSAAITQVSCVKSSPEALLYQQLKPKETDWIIQKLEEWNYEYEVSEEGDKILVLKEDVYSLRAKLALGPSPEPANAIEHQEGVDVNKKEEAK